MWLSVESAAYITNNSKEVKEEAVQIRKSVKHSSQEHAQATSSSLLSIALYFNTLIDIIKSPTNTKSPRVSSSNAIILLALPHSAARTTTRNRHNYCNTAGTAIHLTNQFLGVCGVRSVMRVPTVHLHFGINARNYSAAEVSQRQNSALGVHPASIEQPTGATKGCRAFRIGNHGENGYFAL